ncbi:MAG: MerR family transcriptional regulator [Pseudomonadota bacterium]
MRIGDLARKTGLSTSRIRFYEGRGLLPPAERGGNGYRDYPDATVGTLTFIEQAQALGFSLREIQSATFSIEGGVASESIVPTLERKLRDVEAHIAASLRLWTQLKALIAEQKLCCPPEDAVADR